MDDLKENNEFVTNKKGEMKPDTTKRDYERIPLKDEILEYFEREVVPYLKDSWLDRKEDTVGYEINFTKYFCR